MIKVLDIISNMNDLYQDQLKDSGILLTLVNLLNNSIPTNIPNLIKIASTTIPPTLNNVKTDDFFENIIPGVVVDNFDYVNSNNKWSCEACTFLNEDILDTCSICGTDKPDVPITLPPPPPPPLPQQQATLQEEDIQVDLEIPVVEAAVSEPINEEEEEEEELELEEEVTQTQQ